MFSLNDSAYCLRAGTNITLSNQIAQNNLVLSGWDNAAVGTTVFLAGLFSGVQSGVVTEVDFTIGNQTGIRATYFSQNGDSGGPIYIPSGTQRRIVGVHWGSIVVGNVRQGAVYGAISNTLANFGLSLF